MKRVTLILAGLLALSPTFALADGMIGPPVLPPLPQVEIYTYPRHIYRDGNYFFCPYADYDPYCRMPNDHSWALYGPPWRQRPPVVSVPVVTTVLPNEHVPFAETATPTFAPPHARAQVPVDPPQESMDDSRDRVIQLGEEHCRKYPQDTQVCHPPKR